MSIAAAAARLLIGVGDGVVVVEVEGVTLPPTTTLQALQLSAVLSPDDIPSPCHSAQETLYSPAAVQLQFQSIIPDGCKEFWSTRSVQ